MANRNLGVARFLGIAGILAWVLAIFLRETALSAVQPAAFLLGVAPNFGAALILAMLAGTNYSSILKRPYTRAAGAATLAAILLLAITSEIVHALFLDARFDPYDIAATLLALAIAAASLSTGGGVRLEPQADRSPRSMRMPVRERR